MVGESPAVVTVEPQHRAGRTRREAEQQIGIAVGVEVSERRGPRRPRVGDARSRRDVGEHALVVPVEAVGRAIEADEQIQIAVAVDVGERVHQVGAGGERRRLDRLEAPRRRLRADDGGCRGKNERKNSEHGAS